MPPPWFRGAGDDGVRNSRRLEGNCPGNLGFVDHGVPRRFERPARVLEMLLVNQQIVGVERGDYREGHPGNCERGRQGRDNSGHVELKRTLDPQCVIPALGLDALGNDGFVSNDRKLCRSAGDAQERGRPLDPLRERRPRLQLADGEFSGKDVERKDWCKHGVSDLAGLESRMAADDDVLIL